MVVHVYNPCLLGDIDLEDKWFQFSLDNKQSRHNSLCLFPATYEEFVEDHCLRTVLGKKCKTLSEK
jgi:hypothetical protein